MMKQNLIEEVLRFNLLSNYDNSKTLSEQTNSKILSEDVVYDIYKKFYEDGAEGAGTNPVAMRDGIKMINSADLFWKVNEKVKYGSGQLDIAGVINDEMENNNLYTVQVISNHLKTIGITSTFQENSKQFVVGSFKITTPVGKSDLVKTPAAAALPEWTKAYSCLSDSVKLETPANDSNFVYSKFGDDMVYYYDTKRAVYIYATNKNKKNIEGTWSCTNNGLLIKLNDGSQWDKVNKWTEPKKVKSSGATSTAVAIPTELKDTNGVKAFQDWLDTNAPGWAEGYKDGKISQGEVNAGYKSGGYGTFGKRTQKAWNNPTYKDQYLKSLTTGEDVSISEVPATTNPNEY